MTESKRQKFTVNKDYEITEQDINTCEFIMFKICRIMNEPFRNTLRIFVTEYLKFTYIQYRKRPRPTVTEVNSKFLKGV